MRKLVTILTLMTTLGLSISPAAQQYYTAALSAMQMGDCSAAILWFEKALTEDPEVENVDPNVKLWIGVCAYEIGDYAKAKDFLKLYPDNELAKTILNRIERGLSPEEREWELIKSLISKEAFVAYRPETPSTPSTVTEVKGGKSPLLIFLGVFVVTFAALMILELKFALISALVAKIPRVRIVIGEVEIKEVVHETMEEKEEEKEEVEEKEIEIDIEELFNSPLEVVDKLIYGEEFEVEEEKEEHREAEEEKTEMEMVAEELVSTEEGKKEEVVEEAEKVEEKPPEVFPETSAPAGEITEEDIEEIEKRAEEVLGEIEEEEEEGISLDLAGKSADEILEELEGKEEYDEEDAEKMLHAIRLLVSPETEEGEEET